MKKILLIFNGSSSPNLLNFGCYIAGLTRARLIGIFPEEIEYDENPGSVKKVVTSIGGFLDVDIRVDSNHSERVTADIRRFQEACERKGIHATVHKESRFSISELAEVSRFSDLIILDATPPEGLLAASVHERLIKELIPSVECPVIVAPASFEEIEEVVFWYNGSASAAFAMKQFTYLLTVPEYIKATIAVTQQEEQKDTYDKHHIMDWLSRFYEYGDVFMLKEHAEKSLFDYLLRKKKVMVVTGAHGRAMLYRFFQHSELDLRLNTLPFPLFIAHH